MIKNTENKKKGFMLLLAIMVSAIIISIGFAISNFILKELILTFTVRNSVFAFYSADSGVECAAYWDDIFSERLGQGGSAFDDNGDGPDPIICNGHEINLNGSKEFGFHLGGDQSGQYVDVVVSKSAERTKITADGYNREASGPRKVGRRVEFSYDN